MPFFKEHGIISSLSLQWGSAKSCDCECLKRSQDVILGRWGQEDGDGRNLSPTLAADASGTSSAVWLLFVI